MWDRIRIGRSLAGRSGIGAGDRAGRRIPVRPRVESLEQKQLMASLAAISNVTVPAQQGYVQPLDGSGTTDPQTFTVTSSNPAIPANVISGPVWTVDLQYTNPTTSQVVTEPMIFQLFNSAGSTTLTPNTVNHIEQFTNDDYYTSTGKYITRIASGFPNANNYVVQGGAPTSTGSGNSGQPNTPFNNENVQQLAFTGTAQIAMANAGINTNDTQFFITTGSPNSVLGYNYTIFGQMIPNPTSGGAQSDQTTLNQLTQLTVTTNPVTKENSLPVNQPIITGTSLSNSYPSGAMLIDTTQARAGQTSTITVTATDRVNGTTTSQNFLVTVGAYSGATSSNLIQTINFRPLANATTATTSPTKPVQVSLAGQGTYPVSGASQNLSYALTSQPAHGTVSNFNPNTGTLTYTPSAGYSGTDTFQYAVTSSGPNAAPAATSSPGTVTVTISPTPPVFTGAVRQVGTVLLVTPVPSANPHQKNVIDVVQATPSGSTSPVIQVYVNGQLDRTQPSVTDIDSIIVFGSKANDQTTIDPSVTIPALLDGGHGGHNRLKGGSGETLEHGWFGRNTMIGGAGPNMLYGRAGRVKFRPSNLTTLMYAGNSSVPPSGTFYVYKKGRIVPIPVSALTTHSTGSSRSSGTHTGHIQPTGSSTRPPLKKK